MRAKFFFLAAVACSAFVGCSAPPRITHPEKVQAVAPPRELNGASLYRVDAARSQLRILVYRGGPLARLGHNHVIVSRSVQGWVWRHSQTEKSGCSLAFAVGDLVVDDPAARAVAGEDFTSEVSEDARSGTYANMMREEVLNQAHYPAITMQCVRISGSAEAPSIVARVTIKDATRELTFPAKVSYEPDELRANGELTLKQTDFGITPFSVGMGAIQVQDELKVSFEIRARLAS